MRMNATVEAMAVSTTVRMMKAAITVHVSMDSSLTVMAGSVQVMEELCIDGECAGNGRECSHNGRAMYWQGVFG